MPCLSRQTRLVLLLVVTFLFFLAEIIIGYMTNSLALVADSFHQLNDAFSLVVAFWAIRLASQTQWAPKYSYGWQRAEVVGALINGVFLLALCLTILIESIQRFFEPRDITNPVLVLAVGSAGLAANLFGILLFHEHGHAHGHEQNVPASFSRSPTDISTPQRLSIDEIYVHPVLARQNIVQAAEEQAHATILNIDESTSTEPSSSEPQIRSSQPKKSPKQFGFRNRDKNKKETSHSHEPNIHRRSSSRRHSHKEEQGGHLNMHGVFLHVLGDALGNVGVIISALFIWLTPFEWRFYADPVISLIIMLIIFSSALPLVKSAAFILLQGVPTYIPIEDVREKLLHLEDVISVHELHIWQLSDTKVVASVHILIASGSDYMRVAARIRRILHAYGVHSTTIQPEYVRLIDDTVDGERLIVLDGTDDEGIVMKEGGCLLPCTGSRNCEEKMCCRPVSQPNSTE
ncbi:uncharacterized protein VTP21DRAFT_8691 [Calcarisporiella thermophila]|uniref:uncharacterized protein n=1 Tax=Calcarisporiella thermophila TaxID=911321 RepID=UPI0037428EA3